MRSQVSSTTICSPPMAIGGVVSVRRLPCSLAKRIWSVPTQFLKQRNFDVVSQAAAIEGITSGVRGTAGKRRRSFRGRCGDRIRDRKRWPLAGRKDYRHSAVRSVGEKTARIFTQQRRGFGSSQCGEQSGNQLPRADDASVAFHLPVVISLLCRLGSGVYGISVTPSSIR